MRLICTGRSYHLKDCAGKILMEEKGKNDILFISQKAGSLIRPVSFIPKWSFEMTSIVKKLILMGLLMAGALKIMAGIIIGPVNLGASGGVSVPADYDGDGNADPAIYVESSGIWYAALSASGYKVATTDLGGPGATAVSGDFDNDGKADPAVYQESTGMWYARLSSMGYRLTSFASGLNGFRAAPADFDGNGKTDLAVYNPASGDWYAILDTPIAISNLTLIGTFEQGKKYTTGDGKFAVLQLRGTFRQMGRQYGALLSDNINGMYNEVVNQYLSNHVIDSTATLTVFSTNLFRLYPQRFLDMAQGISETAAIASDQLAVINEFFDYLLDSFCGPLPQAARRAHCSGMAVWGDYTGNGPLVMGRDFDFPTFYRAFAPYLTLIVMNPTDGSCPAAMLTYAGQVGAIQAFNAAGLVMENNDGSSCGDSNRFFGVRTPFMVKDLEMLMDYTTLSGLAAAMKSKRGHYPLVYNIAGPDQAYSYEAATYDVKSRSGEHAGVLIGVNHFVNPDWSPPPKQYETAVLESMSRYSNLVARAEQYKGSIDASRMMAIFDTTFPDGGPTPSDTPSESNIYRFVTVPRSLKLWFKAPTYSGWEEIDLSALFVP